MFAGTPPLEAFRMLVSDAATRKEGQEQGKSMLVADVSLAFFEAMAKRKICVEIVEEDRTQQDDHEDRVGLLMKSMYGTRDAAANWQEEVAKDPWSWGFKRARFNPYT